MKKSIWKRYGKRVLAAFVTAAMILPSNFGVELKAKAESVSAAETENLLQQGIIAYYGFNGSLRNSITYEEGTEVKKGTDNDGNLGKEVSDSTISYETGVKGKALKLAGGTTNGVKLADIKTTGSDYTISFWMNVEKATNYSSVLYSPANGKGYLNIMPQGWDDRTLFPQINNDGTAITGIKNTQCLNVWEMVTLSVSGTKMTTYINGQKKNVYINPDTLEEGKIAQGFFKEGNSLYLGVNEWDTTYQGMIDELYVYDRALTADEVAVRYELDKTTSDGNIQITDGDLNTTYKSGSIDSVSVHDPSIITETIGGVKTYYIFGSHMAWAKSEDLVNWTTFTNNINTDYKTIFAEAAEWAGASASNYDVSGNLWAPDIVWNKKLEKWCMYMSVNGDNYHSSIVLLTADTLSGDWTYVDTVVYSGFETSSKNTVDKTDYKKVTGETTVASRYLTDKSAWDPHYGVNAIDPCVFYDEDGKLWMTYGSWFGGIYMLELDESTGLRDYKHKYELKTDGDNPTDPYLGIRIFGGGGGTGEASYIQYIEDGNGNGYYYLFVTYGGLEATSGYNMRLFRSEEVTGPYQDVTGQNAVGVQTIDNTAGLRLMGYHKWNWWSKAQVAQGHNSAFVDEDGKAYLISHTRTDDGSEGHYVIVHQMFENEDGWLCVSPFQYDGEETTSSVKEEDIAGTYEMNPQIATTYTSLQTAENYYVTLTEDGKVTCDNSAYAGTWEVGTNGVPYITMKLKGVTYKGVLAQSTMEGMDKKTITFSVVGSSGNSETALWGAKVDDAMVVAENVNQISVPSTTTSDLSLFTQGLGGAEISWTSGNPYVISNDGKVNRTTGDKEVGLTVRIAKGDYVYEHTYNVLVPGTGDGESGSSEVLLQAYYTGQEQDLSSANTYGTIQYANPYKGVDTSDGITIKFDVESNGTIDDLGSIIAFDGADRAGKLYFTQGSYLGYNATGGIFDANVTESNAALTQYLKKNTKQSVEINILSSGFTVSVDGEKVYDQTVLDNSNNKQTYRSLTNYANVLDWLSDTAEHVNFGGGSWWDDRIAQCKISNVKFYVTMTQSEDEGTHWYQQTYNTGAVGDFWTSTNAQGNLTKESDSTHKKYIQFAPGNVNSRGAYSYLPDETVTAVAEFSRYEYNMDVALTAGNNQETQIAIINESISSSKINDGISGGYILKLSATNSTEWKINDSDETVTIPKGTWVHINAVVDSSTKKANIIITNGETNLYSGTVDINGTAAVKGIYIRSGRYNGITKIDNITIDQVTADHTHTYAAEYTIDKEANCDSEGSKSRHCTVEGCDAVTDVTSIPKTTEHVWDEGVNTATCTQAGTITYTCQLCGITKTEEAKALGHSYGDYVVDKAASCNTTGSKSKHCAVCDDITDKQEIPAGHTWDEGSVTTEPTCTTAGEKFYTCVVCGTTKTETVEALGHSFASEFTVDKEATCAENGSKSKHCIRCDAVTEETVIDKSTVAHTYSDEYTEDQPATCTQAGIQSKHCIVCGISDPASQKEIPMLDHEWSEWIVAKEATTEENGLEKRSCKNCETEETHDIPKVETWSGTTAVSGSAVYASVVSAEVKVEGELRDEIRLDYQWYRSDSAEEKGTEIEDAIQESYTLTKEDIGKYISVEVSSNSYTTTLSGSAIGPVEKRSITIASVSVADKVYDTTTSAAVKEIVFANGAENDVITCVSSAAFLAAGASDSAKAVVSVTLTGASVDCYILAEGSKETTAKIEKAVPVYEVPTGLTAVEGATLGSIVLSSGFSFEDALTTSVGAAGTNEFAVSYTPEDTDNYSVVKGIKVAVTVTAKPSEAEPDNKDDNTGDNNTDDSNNSGTNDGTNNGTDNNGTDNNGTDNSGTNNGTDNSGTNDGTNNGTDNSGTDNNGTNNGTDNSGSNNGTNTGTNIGTMIPSTPSGSGTTTGNSTNTAGTSTPDSTNTSTPSTDTNKQPSTDTGTPSTGTNTPAEDTSTPAGTTTETKEDGTVITTTTQTNQDGSVTETKEVKAADNTAVLTTTTQTDASGNTNTSAVLSTGTAGSDGTISIPESLLQNAAESGNISIVIAVTDETVSTGVSEAKSTVVTVNIPDVDGVEVEKVILTKDSIAAAKETGKGLTVNVTGAGSYTVNIPAKQLSKVSASTEEFNVTVEAENVKNVTNASKKDNITNLINKNKGKEAKTCVVSIAENENNKAGMNVTIPVTDKANVSSGGNVYVYKYNAKTGKLEEVANSKQKVADDGTVSIAAATGTDYVVSGKKLSGSNITTIKDGISVAVAKKKAKAGKAINVKVSLPDTVSTKTKFGTEKAVITYKSSNSKIASVKNGVITTKKKGTVTITTVIQLASGQKVTKKQKITVK